VVFSTVQFIGRSLPVRRQMPKGTLALSRTKPSTQFQALLSNLAFMFLFIATALLVIPPALIILMPWRWLFVAVPAGTFGLGAWAYSVIDDFNVHDPGPAGIFILSYFSLMALMNIVALFVRIIYIVIKYA